MSSMTIINAHGVNYDVISPLVPGDQRQWFLGAVYGSPHRLLNGGISPVYYDRDYYVKTGAFEFTPVTRYQVDEFNLWLSKFTAIDCPVANARPVTVDVDSAGVGQLTFTANVPLPAGAVPLPTGAVAAIKQLVQNYTQAYNKHSTGNSLPGMPPPSRDVIYTYIVSKCECGAFKTYKAMPGSTLHSDWCPVRK